MMPVKPHYIIPALGGLCALSALALVSTFHVPQLSAPQEAAGGAKSVGLISMQRREIPEAGSVLAKHLFVPERKAENMKSNADLLIKGVYIGEEESNVVLSLKSKPQISLRVWEKDKEALIAKINDTKDPRYPLVTFLKEWDIKEVRFGDVTFHNPLTGEIETYEVDYTPAKKIADQALGGYGQGLVIDLNEGQSSGTKKVAAAKPSPNQAAVSAEVSNTINSRISGLMQRMSPEQRQQLAEAVTNANKEGNKGNKKSKNTNKSSKNKTR